jgi:hypothetical protein
VQHGTKPKNLAQLSLFESAVYQASLSEAYQHYWFDAARKSVDTPDFELGILDYLAAGLARPKIANRGFWGGPITRPEPAPVVTMDDIVGITTKLYASEVGQEIECELRPDGTLVVRNRSKRVPRYTPRSSEQETAFDFAEEAWPHLKSGPI